MTAKKKMILGVAASLALAGCSSSPVRSASDTSVELSHYRTFKWLAPEAASKLKLSNPRVQYLTGTAHVTQRPEAEALMRPEVERSLQSRGYVPAASEMDPDFYVTFYMETSKGEWSSSWSGSTPSTDGAPLVIFPALDPTYARSVRENAVYLTVYDAVSGAPVWAGVIKSEDLSQAAPLLATKFAEEARG